MLVMTNWCQWWSTLQAPAAASVNSATH